MRRQVVIPAIFRRESLPTPPGCPLEDCGHDGAWDLWHGLSIKGSLLPKPSVDDFAVALRAPGGFLSMRFLLC
jgi:hypothetical protein